VPLLALAGVLLLVVLVPAFLIPLSIVLRYRASTARRLARGWVATINLVGLTISVMLFLATAGITSLWVPRAFTYSVLGLLGGCLLGVLGLLWSRWETTPTSLHYTPHRGLVLGLTLVVTGRMAYGIWRGLHAWQTTPDSASWLAASGAAGSLAAGAVVLGYYFAFWVGVWRRQRSLRRT
jgi:hypothetical protein